MAAHGCQAAPSVPQCGCRLASSPPCTLENEAESAHPLPLHQVRDRPGQRGSQDRPRRARAVLLLAAGQRRVARRRGAEAHDRRCGAGPRERRRADRRAGGALTRARRCLRAGDHAARGHTLLEPRAAGERMALVEPHPAHHRADAVWHFNMSETARVSFWARMVKAFPVPCVFSRWLRDFWPAGWSRRKSPAASEKAHCREALPLFVPEVPVQVKKPDPRIFARALAEVGCQASQAWFVGDHPVNDVRGAAAAGLRPIWLTGVQPWPPDQPEPEWQIGALIELVAMVQQERNPAT